MKHYLVLAGVALLLVACATAGTVIVAEEMSASGRIKAPEQVVLQFHAGDEIAKSLYVQPDGTMEWKVGEGQGTPDAVSVWVERDGQIRPYISSHLVSNLVDPNEFIIGPGDVLAINVWKHDEVSREVPVRPDGRISLPLLGDIPAAGLSPTELKTHLKSSFARYITDPEVTVIVSAVNSYKIFVQGMVANPGTYPISGRTTLVQVIALAGGLNEFASRSKIIILRSATAGTQRLVVNYDDIVDGRRSDENLRPGDTIIVP